MTSETTREWIDFLPGEGLMHLERTPKGRRMGVEGRVTAAGGATFKDGTTLDPPELQDEWHAGLIGWSRQFYPGRRPAPPFHPDQRPPVEPMPGFPAAGWHSFGDGRQRWWDGREWVNYWRDEPSE